MKRFRRSSTLLFAGAILIAVIGIISMLHQSNAQTQTSQPTAQPANGNTAGQAHNYGTPANQTPEERAIAQRAAQEPRDIAMAVLAADNPDPKYIVNVGAAQGSTLAAWLDKFPNARGEWTESAGDHSLTEALPVLGRFGDRVDYKLSCSLRDMTEPCFPPQTDVIITNGMSIHRDLDGMYKNFIATYKLLPHGGWFINIDQIGYGYSNWEALITKAKVGFRPKDRKPEHADLRIPTAEEELEAMRSAGYDAQIVWQSFNTALFMGRKN